MSGEEKINIRIKKDVGITQALKQLVKDAGENVKGSVWNDTLDKLVELNNQRKTDNKGSIFSGGTERNDWHRNFVVHEGNIEFSKSEMEALLDTMQVSEGVKNRILGETAPAAGTEPPPAGTEPPPAGTEPPPAGEGKTPEEIAKAAQKKGYRETNNLGTFYDEKTKTYYRWDDERGDFKAEENIETIYENGIYLGKDGKHYFAPDEVCDCTLCYDQDGKDMLDVYDNGVLVQREIHNINDDESGTVETYDPNNNLLKTVEYASGGRIIKVTEGNAVSTYSYNADNSYTVTKKVDGKLNQITDYNSEGQEVRVQNYNDEEVLEREEKYTYQPDGTRVIESGVRFYNIIMDKILANPSIIERLGKKTDWDDARKKEAINEYIKDFGADIAKQLGIDDPSKIQPGQILDFSKVKWPQPHPINWLLNY